MTSFPTKYCRLCALELKNGVFIFGDEGKRLQIPEKIRKTLSILVLEEDTLPKKICTDCCSSLEDYAKYKDTVLDAQEKLALIARSLERNLEQKKDEDKAFKEHQESNFSCKVCGKRFTTKCSLQGHVTEMHLEEEASPSPILENIEEAPEPSENSPEPPPTFNCPHCDKIYQTQRGYDLHVQTHVGKRYKCSHCDATFSQKGSLRHHLTSKHTTSKQFKCSKCPKEFFTQKLLRRHERFHSEPNVESKCTVCDKVYKSKLHLKTHMKIHKCNKNYVCNICDKRFQNQYKLNIHENTHTGNRPMKCPHCDYSARTQGPYYRHLKRHKSEKSIEKGPETSQDLSIKSSMDYKTSPQKPESISQAHSSHSVATHWSKPQDLVDCAMQAFSEDLSLHNNYNNYHYPAFQQEPMELSYKLQEMPMELTKVLSQGQEFSQLMDLSSRNMEVAHMSNYRDTERELLDLGAFRQPIDLIARPEETPTNMGNLVDLSLPQRDQSTFLRELIDLSSSSTFHGELNLTKKNYPEMFI